MLDAFRRLRSLGAADPARRRAADATRVEAPLRSRPGSLPMARHRAQTL